jgi:type I restriction enzyme, S subunit
MSEPLALREAPASYLVELETQRVKPGYKQTEVGVIPEDWGTPLLGTHFSFKNGLNKSKEFFGYGTPIVNYMDVYRHAGIRAGDLVGRVDVNRQELESFSVKRGDVFFTRTSETVDEVGIASVLLEDSPDTVFSGFILRARPKDDVVIDQFKKYCFTSSVVRKQIISKSTYTTRALTNGRVLSCVVLPLPSTKAEQEAIAEALSDADALIESLEQLIAKKRQLKQGAMQEMLTGKTRLPGFAGEWEVKQIGEFTDCTSGGTPSTLMSNYWGGSIRWMNSGELNLKNVYEVEGRITEEGLHNSSTKMIPPNCVLVGLAGQGKTRGTVAMNRVDLCTNQSIAAIFPNAAFDSAYLYYNLDARYRELRELSTGDGGRGGLNLTIIKSLAVPFPKLPEQTAIATILSDMDSEIAMLETRLAKTRSYKQGMMHNLLTGRIRLI